MVIVKEKQVHMDKCYDNQVLSCVKQGDSGRYIEFEFFIDDIPVIVPSDDTVEVWFRKPDNTRIKYNASILNGKALLNIDYVVTVITGIVLCEIRLVDVSGKFVTSPTFKFKVIPSIENEVDDN